MCAQVHFELVVFIEAFATDTAAVGPLTGVRAQVYAQLALVTVPLPTLTTSEGSLSGVRAPVVP